MQLFIFQLTFEFRRASLNFSEKEKYLLFFPEEDNIRQYQSKRLKEEEVTSHEERTCKMLQFTVNILAFILYKMETYWF